jgi:hypothetical protein
LSILILLFKEPHAGLFALTTNHSIFDRYD